MIPATDIRPGDVLHFFGEPHAVATVEPRDSDGELVARDATGWGIPLITGDQWPTEPGTGLWVARPDGAA